MKFNFVSSFLAGMKSSKSLTNTNPEDVKETTPDIEFWGNPDTFTLISKASSESQGWMKSTKAMEIPRVGVVIQVTTQQGDQVAEALTFVPGVEIIPLKDDEGRVIGRKIVQFRR
jgi:hypothetical protein